jgi:hypothetical protein
MKLDRKPYCPLIKADCKQLGCSWFTSLKGTNPQTGDSVDEWGCAVTWLPMLLIETSKEVRQGAAATESFRNEMVESSERSRQTAITIARLSESPRLPILEHKD